MADGEKHDPNDDLPVDDKPTDTPTPEAEKPVTREEINSLREDIATLALTMRETITARVDKPADDEPDDAPAPPAEAPVDGAPALGEATKINDEIKPPPARKTPKPDDDKPDDDKAKPEPRYGSKGAYGKRG